MGQLAKGQSKKKNKQRQRSKRGHESKVKGKGKRKDQLAKRQCNQRVTETFAHVTVFESNHRGSHIPSWWIKHITNLITVLCSSWI